jgi:invasion protein IalB
MEKSRKPESGSMVIEAIRFLGVGVLSAVALSSFAAAAQKPKVKFGAWELHCETLAGATSEHCALIQVVTSEDKANANLAVIIEKPPELNTTVLRVLAPLSVYLLNGVSMKIDQTDIGRAAFFRCAPAGCIAEIPVDEKLIQQLKGGKIATLVIYLDPTEGLRHLFRLEGFKEGYEKIR